MKPFILVGGGGHCKSVIDIAEQAGYSIFGILDLFENVGKSILKYKIIGTDEKICEFVKKCDFIISVGQIKESNIRRNVHTKIIEAGGSFVTIISPRAYVSKYSKIGLGSVVLHGATINADAIIGSQCIINTLTNIEHDVVIGDYCHISTGAMVNGGCEIGNDCFIGSQSVIAQNVKIINNTIISAGSFLKNNADIPGIYSGNPAKIVKYL